MKIVTLIPSATEIVAFLCQKKSIVGRSHECDFPQDLSKIIKLTKGEVVTAIVAVKTKDETSLDIPRLFSHLSIVIGNVAADEEVEKANICAGDIALKKSKYLILVKVLKRIG